MAKIKQIQDLSQIRDTDQFMKYSSQVHNDVVDQVNGKLEFDKNLATQTVTVKFPTANQTVAVTHGLKRTSVNYIIANASSAAHIFNGNKSNTLNTVYLQASAAGTFTLVLT